jgi:peptidoglycan-N-acetylglucosamine deacetylase
VQALVSDRECRRHGNPLRWHGRPVVTTFFDVEGDYAMPGMNAACIGHVEKILRIQDDLGIKSTYNVVAELALEAPGMVEDIRDAGHEIASHSLRHRVLSRLPARDLTADISQARAAFARLGIDVSGHRSPQSAWTRTLLEELANQGFRWNAEDGSEPHPYPIAGSSGRALWRFPVRDDDWHYEASGISPKALLKRWQAGVEDHVRDGRYVAIGFHPWVQRYPDRLAAFKDFMAWLRDDPRFDILPFGHVLDLIEAPTCTIERADGR